ncbi:chorismate--pyruvate lyase family protein [Conchiformibius kuhniae]|uniref:Chorismate--pyruvate lyase family protein n=1 Tax=Conchiformibius kuhniae TaxID=211502 RepID=A0A8T9MVU2_9NEIS|nr:hypothetical protein [Conchiformibius kuhniae]UOP05244.1 chorismate lyase [Conchiformibius kuhniae]
MIWQTDIPPCAAALRRIAVQQSLTRALGEVAAFSVRLRHLGAANGVPPHFADWRLPAQSFVREVDLCLNGAAVGWAQSLCAADSAWRAVLDCGNTSLGAKLFGGGAAWRRSELAFTAGADGFILMRRSRFTAENGDELYLAEGFLPNILDFL